ncbi:hypothetical protein [Actinomadura hibisca]|uniref:hypothetical protein n=1 Tax=Actinomadura hibisca TaxID=68565 RepID=UPI0008363A44|nr:hypothetical protein [Actinomadura hibisca]
MEITVTGSHEVVSPEDTRPDHVTVTITFTSSTDDPQGHVYGLLLANRLANVLRAYGQGQGVALDEVNPDDDLWDLLTDCGRMGRRLDSVTRALIWVARDTRGQSWNDIANGVAMPRKTVRNIAASVRDEYARRGYWRDARGLHRADDPEYAQQRAEARTRELNARAARDEAE